MIMISPSIQDRIAFLKEKLSICYKVKSQIPQNDPYRDLKLQSMEKRISLYSEELQKLEADNLKNWIV